MGLSPLLQARRDEIRRIAACHGAHNLRVFGSTVRGEETADSDIDILIDLAQGRSLLDIVALKQDLEDLLGRHVDVVTNEAISPYLRETVLSEAVEL
jgi:hypothetical protein